MPDKATSPGVPRYSDCPKEIKDANEVQPQCGKVSTDKKDDKGFARDVSPQIQHHK